MSVLEVNHVKKIYTTRLGGNKVEALHDISFSVENGEYIAIMGESGSGKTTLLNILAALDKPTAGEVILKGIKLSEVKESQIAQFRRDNLGFVFQDFNLLDTFSLRDNIFLPLVLAGKTYGEMYRRLEPIADKLGISHLLSKYPYEVSGGQKQRCAAARALITNPQIILADEPTGNLDSKSSTAVIEAFLNAKGKMGATIFMVTHDAFAASYADKVIALKDGIVFGELVRHGQPKDFLNELLDFTRKENGDGYDA